jgi:fermentation-respiration switch protein FrsA (DUF1100 family)
MTLRTKLTLRTPPTRRPALLRFALSAVRVIALLYVGVLAILAVEQRFLIFPGGHPHDTVACTVNPGLGARIVDRATGGPARILGVFEPALGLDHRPVTDIASRPTLLYFYGNGSSVIDSVGTVSRFRKDGVNVFIPEYAGYGMNGGQPSEQACYRTADAAYAYLTTNLHIAPSRIIIAGWSLGSAVAIDLASRVPSAGLVVISPFTNMADESSSRYPIFPAWLIRLVLTQRFENDKKIGRVRCPILDIHSRTDEVIPFDMSARLLVHAKSAATRIIIDHAYHNEFFTVGGNHVYQQMLDFVRATARK